MAIGILGAGAHLPPRVIDNAQIAEWADTTTEWIEGATGIYERRYADPDTPTSELAYGAVQDLLSERPDALDVDWLILATSTADRPQPATAADLQARLGTKLTPGFDLNAVCAGFLYALVVGHSLAITDACRVLVVAADKYSTIMDRKDRRTVSLFGDGAGAVLLGPVPDDYGIRAHQFLLDGQHAKLVEVVGGGSDRPLTAETIEKGEHLFRMRGREVAAYITSTLPGLIISVLDQVGLRPRDVDRWLFHQANPKMIGKLTRTLGIDSAVVPLTAPMFGNTASASIPVTLQHTHRDRPIRRGDWLVLATAGGGLSLGVVALRWY